MTHAFHFRCQTTLKILRFIFHRNDNNNYKLPTLPVYASSKKTKPPTIFSFTDFTPLKGVNEIDRGNRKKLKKKQPYSQIPFSDIVILTKLKSRIGPFFRKIIFVTFWEEQQGGKLFLLRRKKKRRIQATSS